MEKTHMVKSAIGSIALVAVLAGCAAAPPPEKPADEVLKDGLMNLTEVKAYSYDLALKGDLTDPLGDDVQFDFMLKGAMDAMDMSMPKMVLNLDGSATSDAGGGNMKGEVRLDAESLYFNIMDLAVDGEELPAEFTEMMNKWWMIPVPEGALEEFGMMYEEDEAMKEEMKQAMEDVKVFATPEFVGTENVMGVSSHRYKVNVDKRALLEFAREASEAQGDTVSDAEFEEALAELDSVDIAGDVWVTVDTGIMNKFDGTITLRGGEGEPSGTISMTVTLGNFGEAVTVQAPADAEEFPVDEVLGPLMMMGGMGAMDNSMMMDDSMMFDDAAMEEAMMDAGMTDAEIEAAMESFGDVQLETVGDVGIEIE